MFTGRRWSHLFLSRQRAWASRVPIMTLGVIRESTPDDDGDMHGLLFLDQGQANLVNKRNQTKKGGGLVIEIVCAVQPKSPKAALKACKGYHASVAMPGEGTHARVSGTYVIDTNNGWAEIHPVSRIDPIR